jgi:hypothetical protein
MNRFFLVAAGLLISATCLRVEAQVLYSDRKVGTLQAFYDGADCVFFKLEGVTQADPIKPNDPMFAIAATQAGAKNAYAALLAAKLAGLMPIVRTRGNLVCGYAGVAELILP